MTVEWDEGMLAPGQILDKLDRLGYPAYPFSAPALDSVEMAEERRLLRCLGVAAFGAMNVMLLSVSLWGGADKDPSGSTRDFFHWLSALVALPAVAYAGRAVLRERAARVASARVQHGRADYARRAARARDVGRADDAARRGAYFDSA